MGGDGEAESDKDETRQAQKETQLNRRQRKMNPALEVVTMKEKKYLESRWRRDIRPLTLRVPLMRDSDDPGHD